MYAVIDIETSGGRVSEERIIEVAVYRFDGREIVDQFISLVNPEGPIQYFVQKLTGISPAMVRRAPKFHEIAKRLIEITEGAVFVAHNVGFDYRVVQEEFDRLGYDFQRKTLDTIIHAQRLVPDMTSYGLDPLCDSLGILNTNRHRADGDARATVKLLSLLLDKDSDKEIEAIARKRKDTTPDHNFSELTATLYNTTGLYYVYNRKGEVIYLGQSQNLRNQIDLLFLATNDRALQLQQEADSISIDPTGSEMVALLLEHLELRKLKPPLNKKNDKYALKWGLFIDAADNGTEKMIRVQKVSRNTPLMYFDSEDSGIEFAACYCRSRSLHPKKVALSFQQRRMLTALEKLPEMPQVNSDDLRRRVRHVAFRPSDALLLDKGRQTGEKTAILVEDGMVTGFGYFDLEFQLAKIQTVKNAITRVPASVYLNSLVYDALQRKKITEIRPVQKKE